MLVLEAREARRRLANVVDAPVEIIAAGGRSAGDVVEAVAEQRTGREFVESVPAPALLFLRRKWWWRRGGARRRKKEHPCSRDGS